MLFCIVPFSLWINSLQFVIQSIKFISQPVNFIMNYLESFKDCIKFMFPKHYNLLILHFHLILTSISFALFTLFIILIILMRATRSPIIIVLWISYISRSTIIDILILFFLNIYWDGALLLLILTSLRWLLEICLHLKLRRSLQRLTLTNMLLVLWWLLVITLIWITLRLLTRIKRCLPHLF